MGSLQKGLHRHDYRFISCMHSFCRLLRHCAGDCFNLIQPLATSQAQRSSPLTWRRCWSSPWWTSGGQRRPRHGCSTRWNPSWPWSTRTALDPRLGDRKRHSDKHKNTEDQSSKELLQKRDSSCCISSSLANNKLNISTEPTSLGTTDKLLMPTEREKEIDNTELEHQTQTHTKIQTGWKRREVHLWWLLPRTRMRGNFKEKQEGEKSTAEKLKKQTLGRCVPTRL